MMNNDGIQIFLQLISIPGCESKSWTISVWPFCEAKIKGVILNMGFNSTNDLKLKYHEIIKCKYYQWFLYLNIFAVDFNTWLWK